MTELKHLVLDFRSGEAVITIREDVLNVALVRSYEVRDAK